ncbi:MAG: cytidylate kinase family protein [Propionicimonas sp.]
MNTPGAMRPVVTLWETYGSGATTVGSAVASALHVPFLAQHLSSEELEAAAEPHAGRDDSLLTRLLDTLGRTAPSADAGVFSGAALTRDVADHVRRLREAVTEGGVVIGRNATVILADVPTALHVKLDGPLEQRLARAASEAGIDLAHARARQAREDRVRAELSLRLHNWDPRDNDRFDLVINTGMLSTDMAAAMIVAAYRIKVAASG